MDELTDDALLEELGKRLLRAGRALHDVKVMNEKIEKLNIKLAESERLKTNFLSNIRNEINNPLTSILGLSRQLAHSVLDESTRQVTASLIYRQAFELDFQLRNIFAAAEVEAGESGINPAQTDVCALVTRAAAAFRQQAQERNLEIEVSLPEETGSGLPFTTDPEKLHLILSNLIANAVEYNEQGKTVRIEARRESGSLHLSVADEGKGISERDRERLFERFRQLDQGPSKRHKGHGLGLSITKALVEVLGGSISTARGTAGGTVFHVVVPEARGETAFSEDGTDFRF